MSLRWRIAIGLGLVAALVGAFAAVGAYVTTARQLRSAVDESLVTRVAAVQPLGPRGEGVTRGAGPCVRRPVRSSPRSRPS